PLDLHSFPTRRSSDLIASNGTITQTAGISHRRRLLPSRGCSPPAGERVRFVRFIPLLSCDWDSPIGAGSPAAQTSGWVPLPCRRSEEHTSELQSRENL